MSLQLSLRAADPRRYLDDLVLRESRKIQHRQTLVLSGGGFPTEKVPTVPASTYTEQTMKLLGLGWEGGKV